MSLPTLYQSYIHMSKYSRFMDQASRRELWPETVQRYFNFFTDFLQQKHGLDVSSHVPDLYDAVHDLESMPSMRALMTAGPALARDHIAGYNCAYREIDSTKAFAEIMFILMCGTGISWSVERQVIKKLPKVPETLVRDNGHCIHVRDSKRGWASAIRELLQALYNGKVPGWDTSKVRPYGARLKKMGGRASGPEPLIDAFKFIVHTFENARGRQLNSTECHDIACVISDAVVVGGVRRAAALSLSNLSDQRMRDAKTGAWWETTLFRRLANNSVAYTERPEVGQFMQEWMSLYESKSGERGIFNREAARNQAMASGRRRGFWDQPLGQWDEKGRFVVPALADEEEYWQAPIAFGTNPCAEIILRSEELCNLSSPIARPDDTDEDLERKVRNAAIMGTWQACLTDFRFVGEKWRRNCEEERLLGVSLSGMMDCPLLNDRHDPDLPERLEHLKLAAVDENIKWAKELGINPAAAVTCVKPEGNSSQLVASASGIHPEYAHKYIRRVRQSTQDPLTQFMIDNGFVGEPERGKEDRTMVFSFPRRIADEAMTRDDMTAIDQLEHWKLVQDHYCEHKPSITVYVREHEWPEVGAWAWNHFDQLSGVSFLPFDGGSYHQAPYEAVGEEELQKLEAAMPQNVDWSELGSYEDTDNTTGSRELACTSGTCEVR